MSIAGVSQDTKTAQKDYICDSCGEPIHKGFLYCRERTWGYPDQKYHLGGELGGAGCDTEEIKLATH